MSYKIELFTTSDCQNCKIAKMILDQYMVNYLEKNIELNKELETEFVTITKGQKYVPTLVVNGNPYINIKPHELLELVKILKSKENE